ncbi:hypothetical protein CY35_16G074900 [Sphagnum magellanicum]|nr:hypothetical protein CY35_16G074900 [Sphagnum magellanicum]
MIFQLLTWPELACVVGLLLDLSTLNNEYPDQISNQEDLSFKTSINGHWVSGPRVSGPRQIGAQTDATSEIIYKIC